MLFILILVVVACRGETKSAATVDISSGRIQGSIYNNRVNQQPYYAFQGVPYAKPPIGHLRFQAPEEPDKWNGTLMTTKEGNDCLQSDSGDENCLYLNVYTNKLSDESLVPVMVWVHGGDFINGSGTFKGYGPDYLLLKDVVLVTFNYRLSVFGFLSSVDDAAPGNAGLKDQVAVLRWVQRNIAKFNGNPNCVTVFGQSAGGVAVQYLFQSKLTRGLFHRVISQSGSTLNPWALQENPREKMNDLVKILGISANNTFDMVKQLQGIESSKLFDASYRVRSEKNQILIPQPFSPSVEHDHPEAFNTRSNIETILYEDDSAVPYLAGYVTEEGLMFIDFIDSGEIDIHSIDSNRSILIAPAWHLRGGQEIQNIVIDQIMNFYFENNTIDNLDLFYKYTSQSQFISGIRNSVEVLKHQHNVYMYRFIYKGNLTFPSPELTHGEELQYIFHNGVTLNKKDKIMSDRLVTLWTNFARTGNPTPVKDHLLGDVKWNKLSRNKKPTRYLEIGSCLTMRKNPNQNHYLFWKNILINFSKYGKDLYSKLS